MVRAEEVYNKLKEDLKQNNATFPSFNDSDKTWTKMILDYFHNEGMNNYDFVSHRNYLNDLVWNVEGKDERILEENYGLELALESEWSPSKKGIMEDFYKLVDVKAFLKVMIVGRSEWSTDEIIKTMSKTVQNARIKFPEEEYLVIIFPQNYQGVEREGQIFSGYKINSQGNSKALPPYFVTL